MPPADIYDSDTSGEPQGTEGGESEMETVEEEVEDEDGGNPISAYGGNHITQRGEHSASEGATLQSSSSAPADGGPGGRVNYQWGLRCHGHEHLRGKLWALPYSP